MNLYLYTIQRIFRLNIYIYIFKIAKTYLTNLLFEQGWQLNQIINLIIKCLHYINMYMFIQIHCRNYIPSNIKFTIYNYRYAIL